MLSLAENCFVSLRPKRARFALSPGQRPVVLVRIGELRPVSKKKATTTSIVEVTDTQEASKSGKYISGGNLVIVKDGKKYNANGIEIK